jgi:hypothetical protein
MAAIPIAEIPNAPRTGDPVLTGGGGTRADISDTTRSLLRPTMGTEGVEAHSRAMQNLGKGIQDASEVAAPIVAGAGLAVAAVVSDFIGQKAEAKNYDAKNQLGQFYDQNTAPLRESMRGQPESAITPALTQFDQSTRTFIAGLPFTAKGREAALQEHQRRMFYLGHTLKDDNFQQFIETSRTTAQTHADHLYDQGEYERADDILQEGLQRGLFHKTEVTDIQDGAMARHERRAVDSFIAQDPWAAADHFTSAVSTGKSQFAKRFSPSELADTLATARQAVNTRTRETSNQLDQAIITGQIANEKSIRDLAAKGRLPEDQIRSHITSLQDVAIDTPESNARYLQNQSRLTTAIENYNPRQDPQGTYYQSLKQLVREQIPKAERESLSQQIETRREKGMTPLDRTRASTFSLFDAIAEGGAFGQLEGPQGQRNTARVYANVQNLKSEFSEFLNTKPTDAQQSQWLNERLSKFIVLRGARVLSKRRGSSLDANIFIPNQED